MRKSRKAIRALEGYVAGGALDKGEPVPPLHKLTRYSLLEQLAHHLETSHEQRIGGDESFQRLIDSHEALHGVRKFDYGQIMTRTALRDALGEAQLTGDRVTEIMRGLGDQGLTVDNYKFVVKPDYRVEVTNPGGSVSKHESLALAQKQRGFKVSDFIKALDKGAYPEEQGM